MKSRGLALMLAAGLACAIVGYFALVPPGPAEKASGDTSAVNPVWAEMKWPFSIDQRGTGRAFACKAADCGAEAKLYLRAKLGSCNCETGVAEDGDLDRMPTLIEHEETAQSDATWRPTARAASG
jgi:hypothetical protein